MKTSKKTLFLTQFSLLLALEAIVCFTPLGSLPAIGPIVATLMMIPVVLTGILLGTGAGALMGGFAGLFSFIVWTFTPPAPPMAFLFTPLYSFGEVHGNFWSLVICFAPRILAGVVASIIYKALSATRVAKGKSQVPAYILGATLGSLTNTFGVLGGVFLFFGRDYAGLVGKAYNVLLIFLGSQVLTSGIPEAILAAVIAAAVCGPIKRILGKSM